MTASSPSSKPCANSSRPFPKTAALSRPRLTEIRDLATVNCVGVARSELAFRQMSTKLQFEDGVTNVHAEVPNAKIPLQFTLSFQLVRSPDPWKRLRTTKKILAIGVGAVAVLAFWSNLIVVQPLIKKYHEREEKIPVTLTKAGSGRQSHTPSAKLTSCIAGQT